MSDRQKLVELCARVAHETNRVYCMAQGDFSQVSWDDAPQWQKESAIAGVEGVLRGNTPDKSHESWLEHKRRDGWVYGPVKDADKKTHPCMVPYAELPPEQMKKDELFVKSVLAMADAIGLGLA